MSKGYGAVQRHVIATLSKDPERWFTLPELAGEVSLSDARRESHRRAVLKLAAAGVVETRHKWTTVVDSLGYRRDVRVLATKIAESC